FPTRRSSDLADQRDIVTRARTGLDGGRDAFLLEVALLQRHPGVRLPTERTEPGQIRDLVQRLVARRIATVIVRIRAAPEKEHRRGHRPDEEPAGMPSHIVTFLLVSVARPYGG